MKRPRCCGKRRREWGKDLVLSITVFSKLLGTADSARSSKPNQLRRVGESVDYGLEIFREVGKRVERMIR